MDRNRLIEKQLRQIGRQTMKQTDNRNDKPANESSGSNKAQNGSGYKKEKERIITELMKAEIPEMNRGGIGEFIISQLGFIRKSTWLLQGAWLLILFVMMQKAYSNKSLESIYAMLSIMTPVLVILTVEEVSRVYQRSMLEIEYATKYSLQKVVLLRLTILGSADVIFLTAAFFIFGQYRDLSVIRMIIYGFTPFLFMCLGCLKLMKNYSGDKLKSFSIVLAVIIGAVLQLGRLQPLNIYAYEKMHLWVFLMIGAAVILLTEIRRLNRWLQCFEQMEAL